MYILLRFYLNEYFGYISFRIMSSPDVKQEIGLYFTATSSERNVLPLEHVSIREENQYLDVIKANPRHVFSQFPFTL